MAASDAKPFPIKNQAYRVTFPIFDGDGDLVSGAAALDSEISKDGGAMADCVNEATEIASNSGMYYLDLTAGEMNADTVAIVVKTTTSGAKTTPIVLYPVENGDIPVNVARWGGTTVAVSPASALPSVDAKSISDSSAAADNVEANIGNLNASVASRSSHTAADVWSVAARTITGGAITSNGDKTGYALTATEHTNIADAHLKRNMAAVTGEAARSPLNALRKLMNRVVISGTTLTVYKEDDSTSAFTQSVTTDPAADPVTGVDTL